MEEPLSGETLLLFGVRQDGGWTIRVDRPHGTNKWDQKHVHVRRKKVKGEFSWNADGSRHDKGKFPASERWINRAKELAADALGVGASSLSLVTLIEGIARLYVRSNHAVERRSLTTLNMYVRKNHVAVILASQAGLVVVILPASDGERGG